MTTTAAEVIERVFTTANPETGSQPPPRMAWAVFANGTAFFTAPSDALPDDAPVEAIAEAARAALRELGPVRVGTPSADFNPVRLRGWYPDEPVWFVGFGHPAIGTVVVLEATDLVAGIEARARRNRDHDEQAIILVRTFEGAVEAR